MPRQPARTRARPTSSGGSPSRIASCHQRHRNRCLRRTEIPTTLEPTVQHIVAAGNGKTILACAEAVDAKPSLWKAEENA